MKYVIQVNLYMYNEETEKEYTQWNYLAVEGKLRLLIFEEDITNKTKIFNTATEAGEYVDKYFGSDDARIQFDRVRIMEVEI